MVCFRVQNPIEMADAGLPIMQETSNVYAPFLDMGKKSDFFARFLFLGGIYGAQSVYMNHFPVA